MELDVKEMRKYLVKLHMNAAQLYDSNIRMAWQRLAFYFAIVSLLSSGLALILVTDISDTTSQENLKLSVGIGLGFLILLISWSWLMMVLDSNVSIRGAAIALSLIEEQLSNVGFDTQSLPYHIWHKYYQEDPRLTIFGKSIIGGRFTMVRRMACVPPILFMIASLLSIIAIIIWI